MLRLALISSLALTACPKDETVSGQTDPSDIWLLQTLNGDAISTRITLTFPEKGKIAGDAPCNSYFATQSAPLPWFETGPIGTTKRACPELALESLYFQTLGAMTLIEVQADTLALSNDGDDSLEFSKDSP